MGEELYLKILERTNYLPDYISLSERIYHIINDIYESCKCLKCGKDIYGLHRFNISVEEYMYRFCSNNCKNGYRYILSNNYDHEYSIDEIKENINLFSVKTIGNNICLMRKINGYLYGIIGDECYGMGVSEAIYFIKNDLKSIPRCPITGERLVYLYSGRYRKHSSKSASANDAQTKEKRGETNIKKYGSENVFSNEDIKIKIRNSNNKLYGADNYVKSEIYKERIKNGEIKNIMSDDGKEAVRRNNYTRAWKRIETFSDIVKPLFTFEEYSGCGFDKVYKWLCVKTGKEFYHWYHQALIPQSPYIKEGTDIEIFIKKYLDSNNINYIRNSDLIYPLELDFYIPDYKLAIECNGLFWHGEKCGKSRYYHLTKTNLCKDKSVRLIHIFSDEINNESKKVISKLNSIFNRNKYKLYARKCEVREIDDDIKNKFLNKYHLQNSDISSIRLGLFYRNKLVSVMTFRLLKDKNDEYELSRFCNNNGFYVIGGASKLLTYFEKTYNPKYIKTYADKRWSDGLVYDKLGFNHIHDSRPNYWYTKNYLNRFHRSNFRKSELSKKLENYDSNKSEWENMKENGWDRIWDCGNMVYEKHYE